MLGARTMKKLIIGNWKMNGSLDDAKHLIADVVNTIFKQTELLEKAEFVVCPPYLFIPAVRHAITTVDLVTFGAQDCSVFENGAYTGDISAQMLADSECKWVILGHSERRSHQGEGSDIILKKVQQVHKTDMTAVVCIGETEDERKSGSHEDVIAQQLKSSLPDSVSADNAVIAYEPVWAIGTGNHARSADIKDMHAFIHEQLKDRFSDGEKIRILYGGSMKPENAADILSVPHVDGGLIGGASLDAESFVQIADAA